MKTDKTIYSKYILIKLTNIGLNLTNFVIKLTLFLNQPTILGFYLKSYSRASKFGIYLALNAFNFHEINLEAFESQFF